MQRGGLRALPRSLVESFPSCGIIAVATGVTADCLVDWIGVAAWAYKYTE